MAERDQEYKRLWHEMYWWAWHNRNSSFSLEQWMKEIKKQRKHEQKRKKEEQRHTMYHVSSYNIILWTVCYLIPAHGTHNTVVNFREKKRRKRIDWKNNGQNISKYINNGVSK